MNNPYQHLRQKLNRPLFIPFTVLGDPNKEQSKQVIETLIESGADALELGLPYSDPPADGPVIQAADARAIEAGVTVDDCFEIIAATQRESGIGNRESGIPVGLLVYFNLVLQRGIEKFYADCASAGVSSVLIADLPLEHAEESVAAAKKHGIAPVFLVSELTTDERLEKICALAEGYLYIVSYLGVTGVDDAMMQESIEKLIVRVRTYTHLPLCVGFGINSPGQVRAVADAGADGVIVGSRIVKEIPNLNNVAYVCSELSGSLIQ